MQELRQEVEELLQEEGALPELTVEPMVTQGSRLGRYEIGESLGAGGMGQVFKARDTRLARVVAIKIVHQQFTERFEREAQAIAALNHPNICTLHDVGPNYLVMELIEGETLSALLKNRGALPLELVAQYGFQIADALGAAHARGIIHRDLKPSNVMVARSAIKVLDFGLSKFMNVTAADQFSADSVTQGQVVIGTIAYMSPEQIEGKPCDARSDIFSLGLILYELASGQRAFQAENQTALIAKVLRGESPSLVSLPERLAHVIERCLKRNPEERWQSTSDIKDSLSWSGKISLLEPVTSVRRRRWLKPALFGCGALLMGLAVFLFSPKGASVNEALRLTPVSSEPGGQNSPVWSPDGKAIAFAARQHRSDPYQVYLRYLDGQSSSPITHFPEGASPTEWLADGRILFRSAHPARRLMVSFGGGRRAAAFPRSRRCRDFCIARRQRHGGDPKGRRQPLEGVDQCPTCVGPGTVRTGALCVCPTESAGRADTVFQRREAVDGNSQRWKRRRDVAVALSG
jgi:serine/threonine protein kinase